MSEVVTDAARRAIESSVLCWLATVSEENVPNVSPKEAFAYGGRNRIWVANIASPITVRNIRACPDVCISFLDIFTQKGYKIHGRAKILDAESEENHPALERLASIVGGKFKILSVIEIEARAASPIVAPSYRFFPETTETEMVKQSLASYGVDERMRDCD